MYFDIVNNIYVNLIKNIIKLYVKLGKTPCKICMSDPPRLGFQPRPPTLAAP